MSMMNFSLQGFSFNSEVKMRKEVNVRMIDIWIQEKYLSLGCFIIQFIFVKTKRFHSSLSTLWSSYRKYSTPSFYPSQILFFQNLVFCRKCHNTGINHWMFIVFYSWGQIMISFQRQLLCVDSGQIFQGIQNSIQTVQCSANNNYFPICSNTSLHGIAIAHNHFALFL